MQEPDPRAGKWQAADHGRRWVTALVALAVLVACVAAGGVAFSALGLLGALGCLREFQKLARAPDGRGEAGELAWVGYAAAVALVLVAHAGAWAALPAVAALHLVCCGALGLRRFPADRLVLAGIARQVLGLVYCALPIALFIALRSMPEGVAWVLLTCAVVFAGDSAAFYVGTLRGRHKLAPAISPGKTVEGAIAGLAASLLTGALGAAGFLSGLSAAGGAVFGLLVGLAGQAGDLFESCWKRAAGVKDSGSLLPGHGGFLDRLDALLFAAPVAFGLRLGLGPP